MKEMRPAVLAAVTLLVSTATMICAQEYPWSPSPQSQSIARRIPPPAGFTRVPAPSGSFAAWLRNLPLRPGRPPVFLFNGERKANQRAHYAVVDVDIGTKDLQQCADAVIRLRAEYLFSTPCANGISFNFTSGDPALWSRWSAGFRPHVNGNDVAWRRTTRPNSSYESFRGYLDSVFTYAGSYSLSRELRPVADPQQVLPGDVFVQGGFPGHAVIVVDVAADHDGSRVFLLAQSYMPAQNVHLLVNPNSDLSPWYRAASSGPLETPQWLFDFGDLRRFSMRDCGP